LRQNDHRGVELHLLCTPHYRNSGQALEFKELNNYAREAFDKGQDTHMLVGPSHKNFKVMKEESMSQWKKTIMEKYNYVAQKDPLPREFLQVELLREREV